MTDAEIAELSRTNERLVAEMARRDRIEQELRKTNELLANSEQRYRLLIEQLEFPVLVITLADARVLYVNHRAALFFGVPAGEAVGEYAPDYWVYPETRERFIAELVKTGRVSGFEALLRTRAGEPRWALVSANLVEYVDKQASFIVFSDITERKHMEEELQASKEESNTYFMNSLDLLCIADTDGYFRRLNPEWQRTLGYRISELEGTRFLDLVHRDDLEATLRAVAELQTGRTVLNFVNRFRHRDGSCRWIEWRSVPSGQLIYAVARDITDRKQAEEALRESESRYRRLHESLRDGFASTDLDGRILEANQVFHELLGYGREELAGRPYQELTPERWQAYEADILAQQVLTRGYSDVYEKELRRRDGGLVPVELRTYLMRDQAGQPTGYWAIIRDITERKRAEEGRLELERRLLDAQRLESLGLMAGGIAHDFNNLLAVIVGNLDLALLRLPANSPLHKRLDQALVATRRAVDLTDQMLAYVGMGRFAVARVDLSRLVQKKAELLRAMVARTITLNLHLSSEPLITQADAGQLEQVVMNLITNASEAIAEQPGTISVTTGSQDCDEAYLSRSRIEQKPPAGRFVFIEVTDTGCGMDEQTQQRLFDPFYTTKFTGRGLGMSATLGIVRGHRGAIILESAPGVGTSIRLLFPAFREQGGTRESDPEAPSVPSGSRSHARTVLIADDEDAVREVAAAFIESLGFRTITAADGEEALRLFKEHAHQLACVLLDLTMPRMDGVSAFREMKRIQSEIPIILCSGYTEREATERFTDKGLAGFIQKPYRLQQLQEQLERAQKGLRKSQPE